MNDNLNRLESAVTATSSGNLTWEQWPHDVATALGLAGRRNPLGFAVVRYLSEEPTSGNVWRVVIQLASELVKRGHDAALSNDAAWKALDIWNNGRCSACNGRGVTNAQQHVCSVCNGTGKRGEVAYSEVVRDALSELNEAERWMDGQLSARLRRG